MFSTAQSAGRNETRERWRLLFWLIHFWFFVAWSYQYDFLIDLWNSPESLFNVYCCFYHFLGVSIGKDTSGVTVGVAILEVRMDRSLLDSIVRYSPQPQVVFCFGSLCFRWKKVLLWKGVDINISERLFWNNTFQALIFVARLKKKSRCAEIFLVLGKKEAKFTYSGGMCWLFFPLLNIFFASVRSEVVQKKLKHVTRSC